MTNKSEIKIPVGKIKITGNLVIPENAESIVIFSHGSGSSRFSPRNNYVASVLNNENMATLLIDLLTPEEDSLYENRFDIDLLTSRLISVTDYILQTDKCKNFRAGYFGASTGAASALKAASRMTKRIYAVVSRGGRPDLAGSSLHALTSPTLLIIGSLDEQVIELNEEAFHMMRCEKKMEIVEGASHLFEEKGTLEKVALLAAAWFKKYLVSNKRQLSEIKT